MKRAVIVEPVGLPLGLAIQQEEKRHAWEAGHEKDLRDAVELARRDRHLASRRQSVEFSGLLLQCPAKLLALAPGVHLLDQIIQLRLQGHVLRLYLVVALENRL